MAPPVFDMSNIELEVIIGAFKSRGIEIIP
jgi:hypothetical protein